MRCFCVFASILFGLGILTGTPLRAQTDPVVPQMAAYRWGISPEANAAFARWCHLPVVWAEEFEPNDTWDNISNPGWMWGTWENWRKSDDRRRLILSVQMLPGAWDRSGPGSGTDAHKAVSLNAGAAGEYNHYYKTLAEQLVAHHLGNSILRIGWEFNGGWYTYRADQEPKNWIGYYRQIVTTMRAVPGTKDMQFVWNPATGSLQLPAEKCWPGDDVVDAVGVDVYDQSWAPGTYPIPKDATDEQRLERQKKAWSDWNWGGDHGLKFWNAFAGEHHKPVAIGEWGVCDRDDGHGGGDDVYFIDQMHQYIADPKNHVIWHCYFDVNAGDGAHQLSPGKDGKEKTRFPNSAAEFLKLFGRH